MSRPVLPSNPLSMRHEPEPALPPNLCADAGSAEFPYGSVILASERPTTLRVDDEGRLHCETGPALQYADGYAIYAWHGVRLDWDKAHTITAPDTLTAQEILAEQNAEIRRVMIDRRGPAAFLQDAAAKPVQQDDYGQLWRIDLADDEPLVMVQLENASLEPDGQRKTYYLRVPPDMPTARAAVAWTFDTAADEYQVVAAS